MKHKDHYNDEYIVELSRKIYAVCPTFDTQKFCHLLQGQLEDKELFARFDCIVDAIVATMGNDYAQNIHCFSELLGEELPKAEGMFSFGWWLWPIGRYVERYGNEDWRLSLSFIKELTKRFTGEYAIRPLLKEHPREVMDALIGWSKEDNVHIRRLASEGIRISLPWSQKLLVALEEFEKTTIILTNLKDDSQKFVQKSVGNNLNDLFKEAPQKAYWLIEKWRQTTSSKACEWIIKHGMRNQNKDKRKQLR
ncbi:DNA alkylation repair protein [Helicobacter sp. MIT 14-3879]|uniref:DNA alkylation repair protein n=1 Tax=Helicobacter sp. MIT 14-3879 TaxID=2040649 RepID=UPI000E1F14B8|nr:DNA alkylation repair protein [Helicobacter sp. MIT 14-3879]RDU60886.1 DNA alkylation repair protein [Helicobacter sp. MIT 14-3879]